MQRETILAVVGALLKDSSMDDSMTAKVTSSVNSVHEPHWLCLLLTVVALYLL